ncbi:hypothetical protein QQZ08_003506 [Neonectria magnoliae]|uniref:Protein kinase domain-containing protein n=1 Tax=Neonectria magnoliae TaxID=2732573 RepID=A0ABR1I9I1_9HYPO
MPKQLVASARWPGWVDNAWEDICLVDWGESFPADKTRSNLAQPADLRPPETYFISSFDFRHDLWRAGSVIYKLFFQRWPFWGGFSRVEYIESLVRIVGPLPSKWDEQWRKMDEDDKGAGGVRPTQKPLDDCFESRLHNLVAIFEASEYYSDYQQKDEDYQGLKSLLPVMKGLLQHEPDKRMSAQEAVSSIQWVDDWGESASVDGGGPQGEGSEEDGSKGLGSVDVGSNAEE